MQWKNAKEGQPNVPEHGHQYEFGVDVAKESVSTVGFDLLAWYSDEVTAKIDNFIDWLSVEENCGPNQRVMFNHMDLEVVPDDNVAGWEQWAKWAYPMPDEEKPVAPPKLRRLFDGRDANAHIGECASTPSFVRAACTQNPLILPQRSSLPDQTYFDKPPSLSFPPCPCHHYQLQSYALRMGVI